MRWGIGDKHSRCTPTGVCRAKAALPLRLTLPGGRTFDQLCGVCLGPASDNGASDSQKGKGPGCLAFPGWVSLVGMGVLREEGGPQLSSSAPCSPCVQAKPPSGP